MEERELTLVLLYHLFFSELKKMMELLTEAQVKGMTVTVEMVKAAKPSIRVCNFNKAVDEDFFQYYFGNEKKSGGRELESVEILSGNEAIITFSDPAGKTVSLPNISIVTFSFDPIVGLALV